METVLINGVEYVPVKNNTGNRADLVERMAKAMWATIDDAVWDTLTPTEKRHHSIPNTLICQ